MAYPTQRRKRKERPAPPPRLSKDAWLNWAIGLLLALSILAAYGQVRHFDFVNYDDPANISQNSHVRAGLSADGFKWAFTSGDLGNWLPVTRISYLADRQWFELDPGAAHSVNVFFQICSSLLLFILLHRLTGSRWRSALVAALFALHPLRVEAVAWISARKDVLSGFFWFAAMLAYVRYARQPSWRGYSLVAVMFCLALMSKPVAVTLPLIFLLIDFWPLRRTAMREKLPLFGLSAAACLAAYFAQARAGAVARWDALPLTGRLANAVLSYFEYIAQMFWPARLSVFYPIGAIPWWRVCAAASVLAAITTLAVRWARPRPWFTVGWLWYLITLLPMCGLIQVGAAAHADRYTYLPSVGLAIIVAWAGAEIVGRYPRSKPFAAAAGAATCALCGALAFGQTHYWENSMVLFRHAIASTPGNWVAYNNLGAALRSQGETDEAIASFRQALAFRPGFPDARVNLCEAFNAKGELDNGARYCREALAIDPMSAEAQGDLGSALGGMGRPAEAEPHFREALRLRQDDPKAYNNLGIALATQGRLDEAIDDFRAAVRLDPQYGNAEFNLGAALANSGRPQEAMTHLSAALRLQPDNPRVRQSFESVAARLRQGGGQ
jgi:Flp pilus assembly protein TadD